MAPADAVQSPASSPVFAAWVSELVRQQRAGLVRAARRQGLSAEDAFDCAQEAFVLFLSSPEAQPLAGRPDEASRYLAGVARNLARNRRRAHALARPHERGEALDELSDPLDEGADQLVAQAEAQAGLMACVHRLERLQRAVVTLRMLDEVPGESAAAQLGLSPGHVAVLLHRAKASLRQCIERQLGEPDFYP